MNIAVILAGGVGARMGEAVPKQFIDVYGKPVLVYVLEVFQNHPQIDAIYVVGVEGWHDAIRSYSEQFGISKLRGVFPGGKSAQESIRNGIYGLESVAESDDVVVIHDGVRPLVDDFVLADVIACCKKNGNAVSAMPHNEQLFVVSGNDASETGLYIPRETVRRVVTPQAYKYGKLLLSYRKAFESGVGIGPSSYANTMMVDLGETLHFSAGSDRNIKLTTKDNLEIFKACLRLEKYNGGGV